MPHALPADFVNESQGLLEGSARWAYNVTDGTFWGLLLAGFCFVLWMATFRYGQERSIGFASITGLFGSIFLLISGLLAWWIASIFILMGTVGITYMIMHREE